jgi:hypothetical protein
MATFGLTEASPLSGIALDPEGWQPLIDARPDWFEVIHLYGTKSGRERLKQEKSFPRVPGYNRVRERFSDEARIGQKR